MRRLSPEEFQLAARLWGEIEARRKIEWFETCWKLVNHYAYRAFGFMGYKWDWEAGKRTPLIADKLERRAGELGELIFKLREKGCIDGRAVEEGLRAVEDILGDYRAGRRTPGPRMARLAAPVESFLTLAAPLVKRESVTMNLLSKGNYAGVMLVFAKFLKEEAEKYE